MPYCSYCDEEYPEGTEECPSCRHLLLPQKPVWRPFDPTKPLVEVCRVQGELDANLLKGRLEVEGIPAVVKHESAGVVWALTVDGLGAQHILVPEDLADDARALLARDEAEPACESD